MYVVISSGQNSVPTVIGFGSMPSKETTSSYVIPFSILPPDLIGE